MYGVDLLEGLGVDIGEYCECFCLCYCNNYLL